MSRGRRKPPTRSSNCRRANTAHATARISTPKAIASSSDACCRKSRRSSPPSGSRSNQTAELPGDRNQDTRGDEEGDGDIAHRGEGVAREQHPADGGADRLPDIDERRVERDRGAG